MASYSGGAFLGSVILSAKGNTGGSRSVFVKLQGNKNDLVFPPFGGVIKNPFKGNGKLFAGDLVEYRTNDEGVKPEIYVLKTYEVSETSSSATVKIVGGGFRHVPCVGDVLMKAPAAIGGSGTAATVTNVAYASGVYTLTLSGAIGSLAQGDVLVEAEAAGESKMLVANINAMLPCDYDLYFGNAVKAGEVEVQGYLVAPVLHGTAFASKMSPIPACAKAFNKSKVNGWFEI